MAKHIDFKFDDTAEDAAKHAEELAAQMVKDISAETEQAIRNAVAEAIREGIPPYDAARLIVPLIGLTSAQAQAVMKYREKLIDNGLTLEKVNEKVDQYADDTLARRGDAIARSEILDALNTAQEDAWAQAQDAGLLSPDATKIVILSDNPCQICQDIEAEGPVPIDEGFSEDGPPFHTNCECTEGIDTP
jgi:hypothetical protein